MSYPRHLRISVSAIGLAAAMLPACATWAATPLDGVIDALQKKYVVTQTTADLAQITKDGTTMSLKCPGIYSVPSNLMMKLDNKVVDGKVQAPGTLARYTYVKMGAHVLQTGEKVYITKIETKSEPSGDLLKFTLLTVDALDVSGSDAKKKYDAYVTFKFKKGYLDETPPDQIEQTVESVMAPEEATAAADPAPAAAAPPERAAPAPRAAAPPAPPPPPPAPAATITIGETSTEVLQAMGMPLQMIDLGKKKTYVYKNMKVVFLNDKVSDVQ